MLLANKQNCLIVLGEIQQYVLKCLMYLIFDTYIHTHICHCMHIISTVIATLFTMEKWKQCALIRTEYRTIHTMEDQSAIKKNEFAFFYGAQHALGVDSKGSLPSGVSGFAEGQNSEQASVTCGPFGFLSPGPLELSHQQVITTFI